MMLIAWQLCIRKAQRTVTIETAYFSARHDMRLLVGVLCLAAIVCPSHARTREEWANRSIYQVITDRFATSDLSTPVCDAGDMKYCGGTWTGIQAKLDYIQGMGFDAIWISPVVENTPDGYHGYWAKNLYNVNEHFGSADNLKALVQACHERDMWVMVDVVGNHVGPQNGDKNDFSAYSPFNQAEHFHPFCEIVQTDWDSMNQYNIEHCRLADLPDLNQDQEFVRSTLKKWIQQLVAEYGFDGIRIDTVPEVSKDFWADFVSSAGVFATGEVFNGNEEYVYGYAPATGSVLDYPLYFALHEAFAAQGDMSALAGRMQALAAAAKRHGADGVLGAFLDNHDNPRFLCHTAGVQPQDWTLLKSALAALLLGRHVPIVYYGTEQGLSGCGDPDNREALFGRHDPAALLYSFLAALHKARRLAAAHAPFFATDPVPCPSDQPARVLALARGPVLLVTSNFGSDAASHPLTVQLPPQLRGPRTLHDLLAPDPAHAPHHVTDDHLPVTIANGQPLLLVPEEWLAEDWPTPAEDSPTTVV